MRNIEWSDACVSFSSEENATVEHHPSGGLICRTRFLCSTNFSFQSLNSGAELIRSLIVCYRPKYVIYGIVEQSRVDEQTVEVVIRSTIFVGRLRLGTKLSTSLHYTHISPALCSLSKGLHKTSGWVEKILIWMMKRNSKSHSRLYRRIRQKGREK